VLRLLVVDDEEVIRLAADRYFSGRGFAVDAARDRNEAESLLAAHRYSAAIVDLRFGNPRDVEGLEILDLIKERSPGTRALLLTGHCPESVEKQALSRGADAILRKPQSLAALAEAVRSLL
jgi:CheY-like chemotaxis protein